MLVEMVDMIKGSICSNTLTVKFKHMFFGHLLDFRISHSANLQKEDSLQRVGYGA